MKDGVVVVVVVEVVVVVVLLVVVVVTLRAKLSGAMYCNRSVCLYVCVSVCGSVTTITRNCVHRSSPNWVCR